MLYSLGHDGAKHLAYRNVPEVDHDALVATLKARGFPVAETDFFCGFVWVCRADGVDDRTPEDMAAFFAGLGNIKWLNVQASFVPLWGGDYLQRAVSGNIVFGALCANFAA